MAMPVPSYHTALASYSHQPSHDPTSLPSRSILTTVKTAESNKRTESLIRTTCIELGNATGTAGRPLDGDTVKTLTVPNTLSQAWYLGRAVHLARQTKVDFIEAIVSPLSPLSSETVYSFHVNTFSL